MNLHRASKDPDWAAVGPGDWNVWQVMAVRTKGVVTPGNIATLIGAACCAIGLVLLAHRSYWWGLGWLAVGRLFDVVDGYVADKTGTKSPLGEILDGTADKFIMGGALIAGVAGNIIPYWLAFVIFVPQAAIALITARTTGKNSEFHTSRFGKYSTAVSWIGLLCFVAVQAFEVSGMNVLVLAAYAITLVSVVLSSLVALEYGRQVAAMPSTK